MIYEKCRDILLRECEQIQNAAFIQKKIRHAVTNQEWNEFEEHILAMNSVESKILELETERENILEIYKSIVHQEAFSHVLDAKGRFYALVSYLPANQRNELTSIYRSLKIESIKLRMANDSLLAYLSGIQETVKDFFALAFPDRCAKTYTKKGMQFSHEMRSMVLNTSF
ncbi:MAG: hypothetical protein FWB83_08090 [Treponema sp.]|nr:hypothetical protein [Treponema sp.]